MSKEFHSRQIPIKLHTTNEPFSIVAQTVDNKIYDTVESLSPPHENDILRWMGLHWTRRPQLRYKILLYDYIHIMNSVSVLETDFYYQVVRKVSFVL